MQVTACNALVVGNTFTGSNVGVETGQCGTTNPVNSWPSAQIGDGPPSDANTFSKSTIDVLGGGCGSLQSINQNQFVSGYRGIVLISQPAQYFEILNNKFFGMSPSFPMGIGVQTSAAAVISKLNANTFINISESPEADIAVGGAAPDGGPVVGTTGFALVVSNVLQAQRNVIHDNDNGVSIGSAPSATFDFSADGTTGNANQIYCNSKPSAAGGAGFDLALKYTGGAALNFAGNVWDHGPPSTSAPVMTSPNGTDVVTGTSAGATLMGGTSIGSVSCTNGRVQ
jgi:hypothetical protein